MRAFLLPRRPICAGCAGWRLSSFRHQLSTLSGQPQTRYSSSKSLSKPNLPQGPCRTRFAPSPTGYLHLGSLRTALFNYLLARATNGQFILRLEDTDQSRLVGDAETRLYDDLRWAGLSWDEGPDVGGRFGPYRQSQRLKLYDAHADRLVQEEKAYRCFCSPSDLEAHKKQAHEHGLPTTYPGTCLSISPEESEERAARGDRYAVRFKSAKAPAVIQDLVYKRYRKAEPEEDFIIRKRDGFPTYHFANVVDDHAMEITHVIRGAEWLISTPKHVELYNAFGWQPPKFAHVGLLVNMERQKLSKRHPGVNMSWYQSEGVLPPALLNFAVLLGWHQGRGKDVMSLDEMVESFSLKFTKGDIVVSMDKLPYFQRQHTGRLLTEDPPNMTLLTAHFVDPIETIISNIESSKSGEHMDNNIDPSLLGDLVPTMSPEQGNPQSYILKALRASRPPTSTLESFVGDNKYLFWTVPQTVLEERLNDIDIENLALESKPATAGDSITFLETAFRNKPAPWTAENLNPLLKKAAAAITFVDKTSGRAVETGGYSFLRWVLLGRDKGPGLGDVMELLGKEETIRRLQLASKVASGRVGGGD